MTGRIAICLIIKNEQRYLDEFVDYYLALGADKVIVYDNDSDIPITSSNPNVIIHKWRTIHPGNQSLAYFDCARRYRGQFKWIGFFDSDEYVILKKHSSLIEFLSCYDYANGVALNWLCFGSSGYEKHVSHKQYYKHSNPTNPINTHIKSFIKPEFMLSIPGDPHFLVGGTVDENGNKVTGPLWPHKRDIAYIKHCITRTKEDYLRKALLGRADIPEKEANFRAIDRWDSHDRDFNESQEETKTWI